MGKRQRRREQDQITYRVVKVPMLDTGLGIEAGYASDEQMIAAAQVYQAEIDALLTPEARMRIERAEAEFANRILGF